MQAFTSRLQESAQQQLAFKDIDPTQPNFSRFEIPTVQVPQPSQLINYAQDDLSQQRAFDALVEDSQALAQAEYGVQAFSQLQENLEVQLRDLSERLQLSVDSDVPTDLLAQALLRTCNEQNQRAFLLTQLHTILTKNTPLLEMLNYVQFKLSHPDATIFNYLNICFQQQLKKNAMFNFQSEKSSIFRSTLASAVSFQTDATSIGKSLRLHEGKQESLLSNNFSLYGQIYNCLKCGYFSEVKQLLDSQGVDQELKQCIAYLVEQNFQKSKKLDKVDEGNADPFYQLLAQLFTPFSVDSAFAPPFLDQVFIFLTSSLVHAQKFTCQIQSEFAASGIKALILLYQGNLRELFNYLYQTSQYLELFILSIFLQDELLQEFAPPDDAWQIGMGVVKAVQQRAKEPFQIPLIFTRFVDYLNNKDLSIIQQQSQFDISDVFSLFNARFRVPVLLAKAYIAYLRQQGVSSLSPGILHYLAQFYIQESSDKALYCLQRCMHMEKENENLIYQAAINYYGQLLAAERIDAVKYQELKEYIQSCELQFFMQKNLSFLQQLVDIIINISKGTYSVDALRNIDYSVISQQFFILVKKQVISALHNIIRLYTEKGKKVDAQNIKKAIVLFHSVRLDKEDEEITGKIEDLVH